MSHGKFNQNSGNECKYNTFNTGIFLIYKRWHRLKMKLITPIK